MLIFDQTQHPAAAPEHRFEPEDGLNGLGARTNHVAGRGPIPDSAQSRAPRSPAPSRRRCAQSRHVQSGFANATLDFARRGYQVLSTDYVDSRLAAGRVRTEADGLQVTFEVADVEALPYESGRFDAVVSTFGAMFAPNQAATAEQMLRVCRSGGAIGMANWTPDGIIGHLFKALGEHVALPPGLSSPAQWGTEQWLRAELGEETSALSVVLKDFVFRYRSPAVFVDFFRTFCGPVHKAFLALDEADQSALYDELIATIATFNTATDGSMRVPSQYAEVIATRI